jgi:peptide/nickel transport system permease protein
MIQYIIRRLLVLPVIILLVTFVLFFLILQMPPEQRAEALMPSVRPDIALSPEKRAELVQEIISRYGLDDPFPVQYAAWLRRLLAGQWGYSATWSQPVLEGLLRRAPASAELAVAAMVPAVVVAIIIGSTAARHSGRLPDHVVRAAAFLGWAFPSFILGLVLMMVFYAWLRWFPPERLSQWAKVLVEAEEFRAYTGMYTLDALLNGEMGIFFDAAQHLVLPGFSLALAQWALLTRILRSSMLDVLRQDYVTTARAKGVTERNVVNVHVRRNAILPLISSGGVLMSLLISGLVVIETVFNMGGIGRAATEAILMGDTPAVVGFTIFTCLLTVLASLVADVLYAFVDPRVQLI